MALSVCKGFREEDFARLHPGGRLGRQLMRVEQAMHAGPDAPVVDSGTPMADVIHQMSSKRLGMTCVVDDDARLVGVFTDGDLRRLMTQTTDVMTRTAGAVMTRNPVTIGRRLLAVDALKLMESRKITSVVVVDDAGRVEGVVHLHDLWRTQLV
jgi:arabinose-5-phosphate isomerase